MYADGSLPAEGWVLKGKASMPIQEGTSDAARNGEVWPCVCHASPCSDPPLVSHLTSLAANAKVLTRLNKIWLQDHKCRSTHARTHAHTRTHLLTTHLLLPQHPSLFLWLDPLATPAFPACTKHIAHLRVCSFYSLRTSLSSLPRLVFSVVLTTFEHTLQFTWFCLCPSALTRI